jgi:hypothetical protein
MGAREALRRGVMNLFNVDFAIEYPRPLVPNVKLIGPVMPEEPSDLTGEIEVHPLRFHQHMSLHSHITLILTDSESVSRSSTSIINLRGLYMFHLARCAR